MESAHAQVSPSLASTGHAAAAAPARTSSVGGSTQSPLSSTAPPQGIEPAVSSDPTGAVEQTPDHAPSHKLSDERTQPLPDPVSPVTPAQPELPAAVQVAAAGAAAALNATPAAKFHNGPNVVVTAQSVNSSNSPPSSQPAPSATVPQTPSKPRTPSFLQVCQEWLAELLACVFAVIIIVIEVVLLLKYDNQNTNVWPFDGWKINSVFALLTMCLETSVAFAVAAAIGQLRWLWFQHGNQSLKWMDRLTNARQPAGAFRFVLSREAIRHWAVLGALLVVALLGVGVFTQNIIVQKNFDAVLSPGSYSCSLPTSNTYESDYQPMTTGSEPGDQLPLLPMITAIQNGYTFNPSFADADTVNSLTDCATGNCTFNAYSTLSACAKCADISASIVQPCPGNNTKACPPNSRFRLPDDSLSLGLANGYVNVTSDTEYPNATLLPDIGPLIVHYKAMASYNSGAKAEECALYWCVNTYNSTIVANQWTERNLSTYTDIRAEVRTTYGQAQNITLLPDGCYSNGTHFAANSSQCIFGVDSLTQRALQNYLTVGTTITKGFLHGEVVAIPGQGNRWNATTLAAQAIYAPCTLDNGDCSADSYSLLRASFANMTLYMSNQIRKTSDATVGFSFGHMTQAETYFHARLGWLAYPIAVVTLTILFVSVTVFKSRHNDPWKSSVVALMFHGFDEADRGAYLRLDDLRAMESATNTWSVVLENNGDAWRFKRVGEPGTERKVDGDEVEMAEHGVFHMGNGVLRTLEGADWLPGK